MRLKRDNHIILNAQCRGIVEAVTGTVVVSALFDQGQALFLHRGQMTTSNQTDICAAFANLITHIAANGACPKNTSFHSLLRSDKAKFFGHADPLHFACGPFGNFIHDDDTTRHFKIGHTFGGKFAD